MRTILILNANTINEGKIFESDVLIDKGYIKKISSSLSHIPADIIIDAEGSYLLPGLIDDQVHFREPGFVHKGCIATESRAAVAGGVTSFMEMPNTFPQTLTHYLLEEKYKIAQEASLANYSFYMGASNNNLSEIVQLDRNRVCGLKVFMGSSTGNMLVDDIKILEAIFRESPLLIATHCEDESIILKRISLYKEKYGNNMPDHFHPKVRNESACLSSSSSAISLAKKYNTRLHILHVTTEKEINLFNNVPSLEKKQITSEVCVHHLWFNENDYDHLGAQIKCNPAIKSEKHQNALFSALLEDKLDVIATDHAPHTFQEKQNNYWQVPAGIPLVQHGLNMMIEFYKQNKISFEKIVEKMCHAPAKCFRIDKRGFIKEGYWADLILVDLNQSYTVKKSNILYQCGWSPFENCRFQSKITHTIVSGHLVYKNGIFDERIKGKRLSFSRNN